MSARGAPAYVAARARTLRPPEGRLLYRFATVSDVHIGELHFGVLGRIHDPLGETARPYPVRALLAAMEEAAAWGAELLVVKGDLTRVATAAEVRDVACLLAGGPVPVQVMLGNHDNCLGVDVRGILAKAGIQVGWAPRAVDVPGLRLVLVETTHADPRRHRGQLPGPMAQRAADLAGAAPRGSGAWVALHHPPELHPYLVAYPPGVGFRESRAFLEALAAAQPASLVTCGHRHRNRRYSFGPLSISEVSSTKDYPGVWAGYRVFEGGVVQTVRRISAPSVMAWTEATRRAMNGQWGRWSPGRLDDRCFVIHWPS